MENAPMLRTANLSIRFVSPDQKPEGARLVGRGHFEAAANKAIPSSQLQRDLETYLSPGQASALTAAVEARRDRDPGFASVLPTLSLFWTWDDEPHALQEIEGVIVWALPFRVGYLRG